jgi:hypothetical protein
MQEAQLQGLCERGQIELMETRYLQAAATLAEAEQAAWDLRSFDTLSRLYLPLQEARRQIRQRCGEGAIQLHLFATGPDQPIDAEQVLSNCPIGQLLVAGWGTIAPALEVRRLARQRQLYVETFLASSQTDSIKIVPDENGPASTNCLVLKPNEIPADAPRGNAETFAGVMDLWEKLHTPFLESARSERDPVQRMQAYRFTLRVDPACELAHQFLADIARHLSRGK